MIFSNFPLGNLRVKIAEYLLRRFFGRTSIVSVSNFNEVKLDC